VREVERVAGEEMPNKIDDEIDNKIDAILGRYVEAALTLVFLGTRCTRTLA
jgi:hypothetical protein